MRKRHMQRFTAFVSFLFLVSQLFIQLPMVNSENTNLTTKVEKRKNETYPEKISISPGSDFVLYYNSDTNSISSNYKENEIYLSNLQKQSVERSPVWIRENLTRKFLQLNEKEIDIGSNAKFSLCDLDSDEDFDLLCCNSTGSVFYFENIGCTYKIKFLRSEKLYSLNYSLQALSASENIGDASPVFHDYDNDGDYDLVIGTGGGKLFLFRNNSDSWSNPEEILNFGLGIEPAFADLDGDSDYDLVLGNSEGTLAYYENTGNSVSPVWTRRYLAFTGIDVGEYSHPAFCDIDDDGDFDLTIGNSLGKLVFYRNQGNRYSPNWVLEPGFYTEVLLPSRSAPYFADIDNDSCLDLFVGSSDGRIAYFRNLGNAKVPKWSYYPLYGLVPSNYYYPAIIYTTEVDYKLADVYASLILSAEDKIADEVAFSIANTPTESLRNAYPEVFLDNARYLYLNDEHIKYANIIEKGNYSEGSFCSTVVYYVLNNSVIEEIELPTEIYYWFIVMPKITDEMPNYIDPESGQPLDKQLGGKFWRDYLFNHNDTEYPPDPDANGDGIPDVCYPKEFSPPLLKEKLQNITILYDGIPYNAPSGIDNMGRNNSRPFGYKLHAIEIVSNWVAKTLPINQAESADDERPIQPVRIARHHNGNCGELQDLTVAAARACLIAARGVCLIGEDHVWNEFYDRGWHQWDNYWSDSGSVIDNFGNYWYDWGKRGGSGIFATNGDGFSYQVTEEYIPKESQSIIKFHVTDSDGNPVDGARVYAYSHWLMEHSVELPGLGLVTIPMPAIWNFTDENGNCTFVLSANNFTFYIVSKTGNYEVEKTFVGEGQILNFDVRLQGRISTLRNNGTNENLDVSKSSKKSLIVKLTLTHICQYPQNPIDGSTHPYLISGLGSIYIMNISNYIKYKKGEQFDYLRKFTFDNVQKTVEFILNSTLGNKLAIVISNRHTIESQATIQLIACELEGYPYINISISKNSVFQKDTIYITGNFHSGLVSASNNDSDLLDDYFDNLEVEICIKNATFSHTLTIFCPDGKWNLTYFIDENFIGNYLVLACISTPLGNIQNSTEFIVEKMDLQSPFLNISSPTEGAILYTDSNIVISGLVYDDVGIASMFILIHGQDGYSITQNITHRIIGNSWSCSWNTLGAKSSNYCIIVEALDFSGKKANASINLTLIKKDKEIPTVSIVTPKNGDSVFSGSNLYINGSVHDDIGISSLWLIFDSQDWFNITPYLHEEIWSFTLSIPAWVYGLHYIEVKAFDFSEKYGNCSIFIYIDYNDTKPPSISIISPKNGTKIVSGSIIEIKGSAHDDHEIDILEIAAGNRIYKEIHTDSNGNWSYEWNTIGFLPGIFEIWLRAFDKKANFVFVETLVEIVNKDKTEKSISLPPKIEFYILIIIIFTSILIAYLISQKRKVKYAQPKKKRI
ncbi:MAG: Ig-like domain-containing protein [Thermoplasmata archaeon]